MFKRNLLFTNQKKRFSVRKSSIGLASVLLGTTILALSGTSTVLADQTTESPGATVMAPTPVSSSSLETSASPVRPEGWVTSDNTSVEVSQPTIATASSAVESTTEPSPLVEEVVQPKSLITPRSVQNHTSANMEVVKTTEDTPKDLKAKILNNKDSLIWFDYNKAKFIGNNNETVPVIGTKVVNDKYNFKHTILKEGMTFEQEIKNHPFLEGARIKLEVSRLLPFTGAEEFKNRLEKYNKDNPNKKFDLSSTDMDQLSKNTYLWDHNKDKRIEKGKEAEIVLRDADRKWSNLFNALNNGEKVVNDNYNSDSLKKSINLPNSVLGSINEAANIGAEFKITLVTKDGKEEAVTLIAADAEEANYSEAIIFKTEGDNWKKLADIGFKGNISDKRWSAKPGEKEVSKKHQRTLWMRMYIDILSQ